ncbi:hypothetical protein C1646_753041 [Rhizophagus diaphanus]|nr:hypothetical protein C1646_753041 [Rhizophagus diaphanus] [Rhizophagus sp. MUCL 43196]
MTSDLEIFLKNSQNTFIEKLLIGNIVMNEDGNILFYEVNEFKLHNIIVQNYDDLRINEYDYITILINKLNKLYF